MPTLAQIAQVIHGEVVGDGSVEITHGCEITGGSPGGITFMASSRYADDLATSPASAVILDTKTDHQGKPAIRVSNPSKGFAEALAYLYPQPMPPQGIHPTAVLGSEVNIGSEVSIGPYAVIGAGVTIGSGSVSGAQVSLGPGATLGSRVRLHPQVVLYGSVRLGDEVVICSGTVIGSDGFGYNTEDDVHVKIPHIGRVMIGDRVEIGANCTIDRGSIGDTVIGEGTKIDNLVHIAHNVTLGRGCLLAGEVGIAGSVVIGDYVTLAAQVGVADHLTLGDRVVVAGKSAVRQSLEVGQVYAGDPAEPYTRWLQQSAVIKKLPDMTVARVGLALNKLGYQQNACH
ncbi:MAG: UDP-3-O-(3-hydroxymyristoyl)glucosamine N-acyltransferase, partial [Candidatus Marinimicrobia bacterium]|nr:UDP-3-O-(3-hydroxymyristoyl)glucosamine N-acyltransferase [Candidatus Neomarinimicrobiota bacterium]